jgi:hypothetical protein
MGHIVSFSWMMEDVPSSVSLQVWVMDDHGKILRH